MLRKRGVVEKFVEFFGDGLAQLPLADRATIANMAPEYGATCGIFPVDDVTLDYLRLTGRAEAQIALVREYAKKQGLWREDGAADAQLHGRPAPRSRLRAALARRPQAAPGPRGARRHAEGFPRRFRARPGQVEIGRAGARPGRQGRLRAEGRGGRHRRHHVLHEYLEPGSHARGGPGRPERTPARPYRAAVGQDLARAGLEGRDGVPGALRPAGGPRGTRLQRRRLRLHDLHRQFRPAQCADLEGGQRQQAVGGLGAVRQPQLRGPRAPGSAHELPCLAPARRRLCDRRHSGHRPDARPDRPRRGRKGRCTCATSGRRRTRSSSSSRRA